MKLLVIAMVSLAIAVLLGHFISDDAGFVVIGYGGKVFRTSFVFFLVLLALGWIALHYTWRILYRFFTIKTQLKGWSGEYRAKRSKRALADGFIALAEGNFTRAEQLLSRGADDELAPAIHYLGAAEAAQAQNAVDRRDNYLSLAQTAMPSAEVAIGIKRAQMQLANNQVEQSRAALEYLADRHPDNKQILRLQQQAYQEVGDSRALLHLLPALRRHQVLDPERLSALERETAAQLLSRNFASFDELDEIWNGLPKAARGQAPCLALYCQQLVALGHHEVAEKLLRKSLTRQWHPDTMRQYGEVRIDNSSLQLERAESWLVSRAENTDLILVLAKLSLAASAWAKAREYVDQLIALAPSPISYYLLAEVHEQAGDTDNAALARREGLGLATQPVKSLAVLPA